MKIKYIVHPGDVRSVKDGDIHFIGFMDLVRLYHVHPGECISANIVGPDFMSRYIHLYPRGDGNYNLPAKLSSD